MSIVPHGLIYRARARMRERLNKIENRISLIPKGMLVRLNKKLFK
jgi:hypothetical protein